MCGLVGYVDFRGPPPCEGVLRSMTARIHHRGPDASDVLVSGACGLGHARLSVIDVLGSRQPMMFPDLPIVLAYNGEIYNFSDLRSGLRADNGTFRTQGDTEVLLRALGQYWIGALDKLDGMFAFAAWHHAENRLLLARDPFGKKPLFFVEPRPGLVVFASEIKALFAHPEIPCDLDLDSLRQVLRFRAVYGSNTLYRGIRQVPPGCWIEFRAAACRTGRYFHLRTMVDLAQDAMRSHSDAEIIDDGRQLMTQAVKKRLVADVPVGAFLSGGLDSSLVVALMRQAQAHDHHLHTFAVGFSNDPKSELHFARLVADALGTVHTEVTLTEDDYVELFERMTIARDAPISEPADLAVARMSMIARRIVTVVLSGEGSDEAFAGYPKYSLASVGLFPRALLRFGGFHLFRAGSRLIGLGSRRLLVAARALAAPTELDSLSLWFSYLDRPTLQALLPGLEWTTRAWDATNEALREALREAEGLSAIARMQIVDCLNWLPGNLLERGDRMTMSASLEMRCPFMDRQLVPFGVALPDRLKVRSGTQKWIVRKWGAMLPREILRRPKWGFRVPLSRWFRAGLYEYARETLLARDGMCSTYGDCTLIERLLEKHYKSRVDASLELWSLLAAELWYQKCLPVPHLEISAFAGSAKDSNTLTIN